MSGAARIGLLAGAVVAIVLAFVLLSPGDDKPAATPTATTGVAAPEHTVRTTPRPTYAQIRVQDGKPVGGVQKITVTKGERARIAVSSPDTSDEIHLHGYDLKRDLAAGGSVRFSFLANADGVFEIELEDAGVQIGEAVVEP